MTPSLHEALRLCRVLQRQLEQAIARDGRITHEIGMLAAEIDLAVGEFDLAQAEAELEALA